MNDIKIKYNGVEYTGGSTDIEVSSKKNILEIQVCVNDSYDNNDFDIDCPDNWVSYTRVRNLVDIIIDVNKYDYRHSILVFSYKLNNSITFELGIKQSPTDYSISISETEDGTYTESIVLDGDNAFDTLIEQTDSDSYEKLIYIRADNGKPFISNVKEYARETIDDTEYVNVAYDNGLELSIYNDRVLHIKQYGKANLYYNHYYVVTLKNKMDVFQEATVTINYTIDTDNFSIV